MKEDLAIKVRGFWYHPVETKTLEYLPGLRALWHIDGHTALATLCLFKHRRSGREIRIAGALYTNLATKNIDEIEGAYFDTDGWLFDFGYSERDLDQVIEQALFDRETYSRNRHTNSTFDMQKVVDKLMAEEQEREYDLPKN